MKTATEQKARAALAALPGTPDEIAAFLEAEDCCGKPKSSARCPVAKYLHKKTGVEYSGDGCQFRKAIADDYYTLPARVVRFIQAFDRGEYPTLVEV